LKTRGEARWWIANRAWDLGLHNFKQILQIFMAARKVLLFLPSKIPPTHREYIIFIG
jgi:hypothetical protein